MKAATAVGALIIGLLLSVATSAPAQAQDSAAPVPPARENSLNSTVIEQGGAVRAEEPGATTAPIAVPAPAAPELPAAPAVPAAPAIPADGGALPPPRSDELPAAPIPPPPAIPAAPETPLTPATPAPAPAPAPVYEPAPAPVYQPVPVPDGPVPEAAATTAATRVEVIEPRPVVPTTIQPPPGETTTMPPANPAPRAPSGMDRQVPTARSVTNTMGEPELVEKVAVAREEYRLALEALKAHYIRNYNTPKAQWAEQELRELAAVDKAHYLTEVELAPPDLRPSQSITAADQLFQEGMEFKNYPAFPDTKKDKLKIALQKFRTIIQDYPTSDKIDDAAFRMGEIYEGYYFQDPARAVVCYERCFQWNPRSEHPCLYNAAKLYDKKLMRRDKAIEMYNLTRSHDMDKNHVNEASKRLLELSGTR